MLIFPLRANACPYLLSEELCRTPWTLRLVIATGGIGAPSMVDNDGFKGSLYSVTCADYGKPGRRLFTLGSYLTPIKAPEVAGS